MPTPTRRRPGPQPKHPPEQLRAMILAAARNVFAAHGVRGATMGDIAREAGVSRQSIYEEFRDKDAIFEQVVLDLTDLLFDEVRTVIAANEDEPDLVVALRNSFRSLFAFYQRHPGAQRVLVDADDADNPAIRRVRGRVSASIVQANRERAAAAGVELGRLIDAVVAMSVASTEALAHFEWPDGTPDDTTVVDFLAEFTLGGLNHLLHRRPDLITELR